MKVWNKVKFPLLIGLIVVIFALIRSLLYLESVWSYSLLYPLVVIRILSQSWYHSDILLDIVLFSTAFFAVMAVPAQGKWSSLRRHLLRPAISAVLVLAISVSSQTPIQEAEDAYYDRIYKQRAAQAEQLVADADEIIYYNLYSQQGVARQLTLPEFTHTCGNGHDMILIDYDTHKVTFLQDLTNPAYLEIDTFELKPTDQTEFKAYSQVDVALTGKGSRFVTHFPNWENPHRTSGIVLYMADGSVYALTNMIDPALDYPYFFGLDRGEFDPNQITCS